MSDTKEKIRKCLIDSGIDQNDIDNKDYIENEILDSMQIVDLITAFEDAFDIMMDADDIIPENFANIDTMTKMISGYLIDTENIAKAGGGAKITA